MRWRVRTLKRAAPRAGRGHPERDLGGVGAHDDRAGVTVCPLNVTVRPLNMTVYPLNVTVYPLNVTVHPLNVTVHPLNVTAEQEATLFRFFEQIPFFRSHDRAWRSSARADRWPWSGVLAVRIRTAVLRAAEERAIFTAAATNIERVEPVQAWCRAAAPGSELL